MTTETLPIQKEFTLNIQGKDVRLLFNSQALDIYLTKLHEVNLLNVNYISAAHYVILLYSGATAYAFANGLPVSSVSLREITNEVETLVTTSKGFQQLEQIAEDFLNTKSVSIYLAMATKTKENGSSN
jgi:hypothetical protein